MHFTDLIGDKSSNFSERGIFIYLSCVIFYKKDICKIRNNCNMSKIWCLDP
ncbi:hypothetical protein P689_122108 [Candidatus Riesia pediculischaeffi PTSU]|uniref:Uncharacterized protein n=1 Tax=Candidatus Riesia pediculischaeffi PTSU TaxID=1401651 RepID=A0A0C1V679_9ENTR|nr:hypothetical protein P689_122108 [Candidatus Riesia pediculischaeffi PTSU]